MEQAGKPFCPIIPLKAEPLSEEEALAIRRQGAQAIQAVYAELGFPIITDAEVDAATAGHSSDDMPDRDLVADLAAADRFLAGDQNMLTVVTALQKRGFTKTAHNLLEMGRQRIAGDYLQPAAIFDRNFHVLSGINDVNDYTGPSTGYRLQGERWDEIQRIPQAKSPRDFINPQIGDLKRRRRLATRRYGEPLGPQRVLPRAIRDTESTRPTSTTDAGVTPARRQTPHTRRRLKPSVTLDWWPRMRVGLQRCDLDVGVAGVQVAVLGGERFRGGVDLDGPDAARCGVRSGDVEARHTVTSV